MQQPTTAENVAKRFGNYLIGEDVKTETISKVIEDFKDSNLQLKVLYKSFRKANNI